MGEPALRADGGPSTRQGDVPQILVVCTANRCRSPIAAAALRRELSVLGRRADVRSAGLMHSGETVPRDGQAVARSHGMELADHRSTRIDNHLIGEADLVVALAREHAREIVARTPGAWPRTFTLKQLVRWLEDASVPRHADLGPWLDTVGADRPRTVLIGASDEDDVPDPIGRSVDVWESVVSQIEEEVAVVARRLAPLLPAAAESTRTTWS
ncbi:hypothetical protein [Mumia sp. DW29H23]|uniref:arsenate reductase/protein-tyrosine-phosphatase family protein n=1 Tax=Mumia sp. DW29H23 TaxID=3421241 RepID=UPI003D68DFBD